MRFLASIAAAALLMVWSPALAQSAAKPVMGMEHLPTVAGTEYFRHRSAQLGRDFHIHVRLPDDAPANERLPVIYLLDGDQTFPLLASYAWYMMFTEEMGPVILVGISYGTNDPAVNMRDTDFTAPAESNARYGGADRFLLVLEHELLPLVERRYPVDPARRVLVGQSLGGQFALHAALHRPGLFDFAVAVNPALHRNLPYYIAALDKVPQGGARQRLYVSSSEFDDERFRIPALTWITNARDREGLKWCLKTENLSGETHLSSLPRAFRNAMRWQSDVKERC